MHSLSNVSLAEIMCSDSRDDDMGVSHNERSPGKGRVSSSDGI